MGKDKVQKINALIVARDVERRSRLKMAMHHDQSMGVPTFRRVSTSFALVEALKTLKEDSRYDILVLTDCFTVNEIVDFLEKVKNLKGDKFGLVLVIKSKEEMKATLGSHLAAGIDGCLYEPFSLETLREICRIAEKVRRENAEKRVMSAAGMVVESIAAEIDGKAMERVKGDRVGVYPDNLKSASRIFRTLSKESIGAFFDTVSDVLQKKKPFYSGPSEILRKKAPTEE